MGLSLNDENRRCDAVAKKSTLKNYLKTNTYKHANCTLTSNAESKTGTAGHDTFLALNSGDLGNSDIIDGGAGTDTLFAVINTGDGTAVSLGRPVISNVETLELELVEAAAGTTAGDTNVLNLDKSSGIKTVAVKNYTFASNADTTSITGVTTATSLKITDDNGHGSARANNFTMVYSGVTGAADSASVEISSTVADTVLANITVAGVETLTVSSTGGAGAGYKVVADEATALTLNASVKSGGAVDLNAVKAVTLNINAADSVTVTDAGGASAKLRTVNIDSQTADKTVTLTTLTPTATAATNDTFTVNVKGAGKASVSVDTNWGTQDTTNADSFVVAAGDNTGGVSVDLSAFTTNAPQNMRVTGGSGNDTVTVVAGSLDKYDTIALGGGTSDALVATAGYGGGDTTANLFYTDSTVAADLPAISGVEIARVVVRNSATNSTVDTTSATFASTLELTGAGTGGTAGNGVVTVNNIKAGQTVALGGAALQFNNGSGATILNVKDATANTADTLNITTNMIDSSNTATITGITAAKIETVSVNLASSTTTNTTIAAGTLTFADATSVTLTGSKITSATVDAKTGATVDASAVTGALTLTVDNAAKDYTLKGSATKATAFNALARLNNADTVVGGSATTDSLTATVTSLDATTGALKVSAVEKLILTNAGTAVVGLAATSGVTDVTLTGTGTKTTLTGLAAGTSITVGGTPTGGSAGQYTGGVDVALANATGAADALTVNLTGAGTAVLTTWTTTGIETINLVGDAAMDVQNLDVNAVTASSLVVTGGNTTTAVALSLAGGATAGTAGTTKLNAATTSVDASAYNGAVTAVAATNTATTFKAKVSSVFTGSSVNDTVTIGTAAAAIRDTSAIDVGTLDGGNGTDTLTVYAGKNASLTSVSNFENINLVLKAEGADYSVIAVDGVPGTAPEGIQKATTTTLTGGEAGYVVTLTGDAATDFIGDNGTRTIDASALLGSVAMTFATNALQQTDLSDQITIKGGAGSKDQVSVILDAVTTTDTNTGTFTMSGVETLVVGSLTSGAGTGVNIVDLTNVTGLTTIALTDGAGTADAITVNKLNGTTVVNLGTTLDFVGTATLNLATATGTADALTVKLVDTGGTGTADTIATDGVESLTLEVIGDGTGTSGEDHKIAITNTNTNAVTLNVVGTDDDTTLTLSGVASSITTINASTFKSALTVDTGAIGTVAMTITSGEANDIIGMKNAASVLDGGTKTSDNDTLNISFSGTGGALIVDLSSSTDQVQMFNGLANAAVQKNFESVTASAYVQTNSVGADITGSTGANAIVGTAYADTIRVGEGADTVTGGAGIDSIVLTETTAAADIVWITSTDLTNANRDIVSGFAVASDFIRVDATFTTGNITDGAVTAEYQAITTAANVLFDSTDVIVELAFEFDADVNLYTATKANVLSAVGAADGTSVTAGTITMDAANDVGLLIAYQGGNAFLFKVTAGADADVTGGDADDLIELVGVYEGIAAGGFALGNFVA
jgi:S-layer protein